MIKSCGLHIGVCNSAIVHATQSEQDYWQGGSSSEGDLCVSKKRATSGRDSSGEKAREAKAAAKKLRPNRGTGTRRRSRLWCGGGGGQWWSNRQDERPT